VAFGGLVLLGVLWGVGARGGDLRVAIFELRPLLYLVAMFVLASNLLTRTVHYVRLAWVVVLAISIQNIFAIKFYWSLSASTRGELEALTEHPTSVLYAWVFLLAFALCVLRGCSRWARFLLVLAAIPTAYVFVLSQRRGAFIALGVGFAVFAFVLFFRRRKAFIVLVPVVLLLTAGYSVAFWNATGGVAFGATAIKSVVSPGAVPAKDASSDLYRRIENYDLVYTIRSAPVTGIGFGRPFYRPAPLPPIAFSAFNDYIPHNSILWIWLKVGYFGFLVLFFIIAATIRAGTRAAMRLPSGNALAVTVAALAFVVMFPVFASVDIAWDPKSCLFLAVCIATCTNVLRLAETSGETLDETDFEVFDEITRQSVP
jgi:O-antigen ligase